MINIMIVDDQPVIRQGIVELIQIHPAHKVIAQAEHGQEALEKLDPNGLPDLIITDIQMPVMNGIDFITHLRETYAQLPVLVLTTFDDNLLLVKAIKAGCNGFLLKDVTLEKLNDAIDRVAAGEYLLEPQSTAKGEETFNADESLLENLSEMEKQILRLAAAGFSNKEIAGCLCKAEGTVKNYLSRILEKTHSRDRTQAVVKAIQWGVI